MRLPVMPPLRPMLAKAMSGFDAIPADPGIVFEPKWDGFRCIVFRDGDEIELGSRNERPLTRYFPEILDPLRAALPERCVVDGELIVVTGTGIDFDALQLRLHPAESRVKKLAAEMPSSFVAFDLLAIGDESLLELPLAERRRRLVEAMPDPASPVHLTPTTTDRAEAADWFERFEGAGLDGLIAKDPTLAYLPDKRALWKVKHHRTAECVVAGFRWHKDGEGVGSLLLGLFDDEGTLHHVGVCASFSAKLRRELVDELAPLRDRALDEHPWRRWAELSAEHHAEGRMPGGLSRWNAQKDLSWEPLRCERVLEVEYDQLQSGRFRRVARFLRWRADKTPQECRYDQLEAVVPHEFLAIFSPSSEDLTGGSSSWSAGAMAADAIADLQKFLDSEWNPDLSVGEWWEKLGTEGWSAPAWPSAWYGRDLSREEAGRAAQTIGKHGALGAPGGLGLLLAGPTIATHGTDEQKGRYLRDIVTGQRAWCQLFSEPGAGSDLAGLGCKAVKDGDEWIINGQKVWTSGGQIADLGMLIARTDPDQPKHQGITWFGFDMKQPGVDVRPLREMTGRALFNEVFLSDARVPDSEIIGGLNNGWAVANTTLMFERAGLGAGGHGATSLAQPGQVAGDLDKRAGDFVRVRSDGGGDPVGMLSGGFTLIKELAKANGKLQDPSTRQSLMKLHTLNELGRFNNLRLKAAKAAGRDIPGLPNIAKLSMSEIVRQSRDIGLGVVGAYGTLHAYGSEERKALDAATGNPFLGMVTELSLFAQAPPIYGGTDQVQRNIIGERILGLPKEPGDTRNTPYKDLPKNG